MRCVAQRCPQGSGDPPVLPAATVLLITDPVIDGHFSSGHGVTGDHGMLFPQPGSPWLKRQAIS